MAERTAASPGAEPLAYTPGMPSPHTSELQIVERHLDTFGHVNNARYLEIFEDARWDWITSRGYGFDRIHALGAGPTVLSCAVKFLRELHNRERVRVLTQMVSYAGKAGEVAQTIVKASGEVACEASFIVGLFDMKSRRLVPPTPEWLKALDFADRYQPKTPAA